MTKPRTLVLVLAVVIVGCIVLFKACSISDERIRHNTWKYYDDLPPCMPGDFLRFDDVRFTLRNDSIFQGDSAIAVVECAYHKYSGRDRLLLRCIPSGRVVEYVDI